MVMRRNFLPLPVLASFAVACAQDLDVHIRGGDRPPDPGYLIFSDGINVDGGVNVIGCILNDLDLSHGHKYGYYASKYGYYYAESEPEKAKQMATESNSPPPEGSEAIELASWTAVGNVLLNLDEFLMPP